MFDKALDTMKDTAVAFSGASVPGPVQQPDLQVQTGPDGTITVCFSDIEGSTAMTDRLGDQQAQEVLHAHNDLIRQILRAHDGYEVKSMGDGFMLAFSNATDGSVQTRLTTSEASDFAPTWSPDGTRIAFVSKRDGNARIYVMKTDGSGHTRLTNNNADEWRPSWSPFLSLD